MSDKVGWFIDYRDRIQAERPPTQKTPLTINVVTKAIMDRSKKVCILYI